MRRKVIFTLVTTILIFALGTQVGLSKEKEKVSFDAPEIMRKLDEVLANQVEMLKQLNEMKQELVIIKIRASR